MPFCMRLVVECIQEGIGGWLENNYKQFAMSGKEEAICCTESQRRKQK